MHVKCLHAKFHLQLQLSIENMRIFLSAVIFNRRLQHTIQQPIGHTENDIVHKIPHKMKMQWQNQLEISVLVQFKILYRIRLKEIDVILVQCPFNEKYSVIVTIMKLKVIIHSIVMYNISYFLLL